MNEEGLAEKTKIRLEEFLEPCRAGKKLSDVDEERMVWEVVRLILEEREECAQICEYSLSAALVAERIRDRSKP